MLPLITLAFLFVIFTEPPSPLNPLSTLSQPLVSPVPPLANILPLMSKLLVMSKIKVPPCPPAPLSIVPLWSPPSKVIFPSKYLTIFN